MAKIKRTPLLRGISGAVGKSLVLRQMQDGSMVMGEMPDFSDRVFSQGQLAHQSRFQRAAQYARLAAKTNPIYGELARGTMKTAYNIALSDWFNPPVIRAIQRREGRLLEDATDNVLVTKVPVTILDEEGGVREKGEGMRGEGDWWEYVSSTEGNVLVEAWGLTGNLTKREFDHAEQSQETIVLYAR